MPPFDGRPSALLDGYIQLYAQRALPSALAALRLQINCPYVVKTEQLYQSDDT